MLPLRDRLLMLLGQIRRAKAGEKLDGQVLGFILDAPEDEVERVCSELSEAGVGRFIPDHPGDG